MTRTWAVLALAGAVACARANRGLEPREGFVDVPGGRVWYQITGGGPGTPLLVLHGGPGVPHFYLKSLAALGDERPVIFYDQLGAGRSDHPSDSTLWTVERFVEELARVREALGLSQVHLYGHSWGTMLAMDYLLTKPAGVRSVIFASPALSIPRWLADADTLLASLPDSVRATIARHEAAGTTDDPAYQAATMVYYHAFLARREPWSADIDSSFAMMGVDVYTRMWGPSEFTATGPLKTYDRTDRLHELALPVLFTAGRYDEARPGTVAYYQALVPGARLVILDRSGHLTSHDEPVRNAEVVREFLREVDAGGR